jgi:large subunit ribosomal protein L21
MTYAIIRTAGKQFRVEPGKKVRLPTIDIETGKQITFGEVLVSSDGTTVNTGAPLVAGASVTGEVVRHGLGDKIVVFKFKRRKNYAKKQGHRQGFTEVRITDISIG